MTVTWRIEDRFQKKDDNQLWLITDKNVKQYFKRMEKQDVAT